MSVKPSMFYYKDLIFLHLQTFKGYSNGCTVARRGNSELTEVVLDKKTPISAGKGTAGLLNGKNNISW